MYSCMYYDKSWSLLPLPYLSLNHPDHITPFAQALSSSITIFSVSGHAGTISAAITWNAFH